MRDDSDPLDVCALCTDVGDVHRLICHYQAAKSGLWCRIARAAPQLLDKGGGNTEHSIGMEGLADIPVQNATLRLADARRVIQHRLEHWFQCSRRPADDTQDLGGGRLVLQRFGELPRPRLHLLEQPRVLDGDHRLVGEGGDKFYLLVREKAGL